MNIACVLGPQFEDSEFKKPFEAFKKAGHEVTVIGVTAGEKLQGAHGKESFTTQKSIDEARPEDFDALFIPGGNSPDKLRANDKMVKFVRRMFDMKKPILAICHGPQLLLAADRYKGYRITAWQTVQEDLQKAGADVTDEEVVVDQNIITSRKPDDIPAFIDAGLAILQQPIMKHSATVPEPGLNQ